MAWTASCPPDDPALVAVVFSGAITGAQLREATVAAAALGQKQGVMRYLVDATGVFSLPRELEFFVLPARMYDELGLERHELRVAVVVPPAGDPQELVKFYETACVNRGWQVKVFDAREPAIAWLGVADRAV
jgi:hypothetical protein